MHLSELTAYAEKKFHISEQHKWAHFPGFSVLVEPKTEKWLALLMRQQDSETGTETELCDIKCGQQILSEISAPYLSLPFRMLGPKWVGVKFDTRTDPEVVYRLFDRAVQSGEQRGCTIVLDNDPATPQAQYQETSLPFGKRISGEDESPIPEKIRQMRKRYEYGDGSFRQKCKNFYVQGKFMADYEDDAPWQGELRHYFPTYHDLGLKPLRGYFTWRTEIRKGNYRRISTSLAYLYLYELLNGIGTTSVEDSLQKMKEFEVEYLDSGLDDESMRKNLYRWMLELAVLNGIAPDLVRQYADPEMLERDNALKVLRHPKDYSDQALFQSLCIFGGNKIASSIVIQKYGDKGIRLFATVWRIALAQYRQAEKTLFTACFGRRRSYRWYPLGNAVYYKKPLREPLTYVLNECREYRFKEGVWYEHCYQKLAFDKKKLSGLLHETDRRLRLYLQTGHPLKEVSEEAWAVPYIEAVIEADKTAVIEASKPKISIRFADLAQIRQDALETQDSLLAEENIPDMTEETMVANITNNKTENDKLIAVSAVPLDRLQVRLLTMLLRNEPVKEMIAAQHGLPEVIADELNQALFEEIGDTAVESDGETIMLVEDYRDDIVRILGEETK